MSSSPSAPSPYPSPLKQVLCYAVVGGLLSALIGVCPSPWGRAPGAPPVHVEWLAPCAALALFALWYTVVDIQAVGRAKREVGFGRGRSNTRLCGLGLRRGCVSYPLCALEPAQSHHRVGYVRLASRRLSGKLTPLNSPAAM